MELRNIIQKLYREREKLDEVIASLEQVQTAAAARVERVKKRRGRTFMDQKERQEVSQRIWRATGPGATRSEVLPRHNSLASSQSVTLKACERTGEYRVLSSAVRTFDGTRADRVATR